LRSLDMRELLERSQCAICDTQRLKARDLR
jgi:hypothetical protein